MQNLKGTIVDSEVVQGASIKKGDLITRGPQGMTLARFPPTGKVLLGPERNLYQAGEDLYTPEVVIRSDWKVFNNFS